MDAQHSTYCVPRGGIQLNKCSGRGEGRGRRWWENLLTQPSSASPAAEPLSRPSAPPYVIALTSPQRWKGLERGQRVLEEGWRMEEAGETGEAGERAGEAGGDRRGLKGTGGG